MIPQLNKLRKSIRTSLCAAGVLLAGMQVGMANAECTYIIDGQWDGGFNAKIRVKNDTATAVSSWSVSWQYSGDNRVPNAWNVNFSGSNPYTASNLSWNGNINPGQYYDFAFQGTKSVPGPAEIPTITGDLCGSSTPVEPEPEEPTPTEEKVYIQVDEAEDHVFLFVNGIEKMRWSATDAGKSWDNGGVARLSEKIDITHFFAQGSNEVKLVAAADNSEEMIGSYQVRLWKNDTVLLNDYDMVSSYRVIHPGIMMDETVNITMTSAPAPRTLTINSTQGEAIYINNVFTGKHAPATFDLAPGEYRVGLGESVVTADWVRNTSNITGQYREQDIVVGTSNITLNASSVPLRTKVNSWRVALIPYMTVYQGLTPEQAALNMLPTTDNIGRLTADDIVVAERSLNVTSEEWVLPISYGLMEWDVTVLPAVTTPIYHPVNENGHQFWWSHAVTADLSGYDMVVHLIPDHTDQVDAYGNRIKVRSAHGAYAGRPHAMMPQSWLDGDGTTLATRLSNVKPSFGMLHESLHTYDGYRWNDYSGIDYVHGAGVNGYTWNDCGLPGEWVCWYIKYMRSQVAENTTSMWGIERIGKVAPEDASVFIGVFNVMRGGRTAEQFWSFTKPVSQIRNVSTSECIDVSYGDLHDGADVIGYACHTGDNQKWTLRHVQNETYHLVSENSGKCAEFVGGRMQQRTCGAQVNQRYVLKTHADGSFQLRNAGEQCLTTNTSGVLTWTSCNSLSSLQRWEFH